MVSFDAVDRYLGLDSNRFTAPMAEAVLTFSATEEVKQRVALLADKANRGDLTPQELEEYEGYMDLDELVTVLKSRARMFLASRP